MLEHEYQTRRKRPRAGAPPAPLPAEFTYTLREATLQDMPAVLALYRHYVRNSVVTFDEKAPTLAAYKSRFLHLQKLGYPFRLALSPAGTLLGFAYVFLTSSYQTSTCRSNHLYKLKAQSVRSNAYPTPTDVYSFEFP